MMLAGRIITGIFILSTLASMATLYGYGSSWYQYWWVDSRLRQNLEVSWRNFSVVFPRNFNGTLTLQSQIQFKNQSPYNISLIHLFQGFYLQAYQTSKTVTHISSKDVVLLSAASQTIILKSIEDSTRQNTELFIAANSSRTWNWIISVQVNVGAPGGTYPMCYFGSTQLAPNATFTETSLSLSPCQAPRGGSGGPGGG